MTDHPRRGGRNRPDSRAMWDESERRNRQGGGTRERRDDRDRYRDEPPRNRDRRQRSRSRSPVGERREPRDRRDRDRDYDRDRRRDYDATRDKAGGHHYGKERDGSRREGSREEDRIPRGPARHGNPRYSASPLRSPLGRVGRGSHDTHSPLPTRSRNTDKGSGHSSVRGDLDDDDQSRKRDSSKNPQARDSLDDDGKRGRRSKREEDGGEDAMDEDEDLVVEDDEMSAMQSVMGFGGFGSTKGQKVAGNNAGAIYKAKKTEYRQYMNRVGGFNRPLSPGR